MLTRYLIAAYVFLAITKPAFSQQSGDLKFVLRLDKTMQQVQNIGASGCWYSEEIGKNWPLAKKQHIAELLFSRAQTKAGQPKGIGLSAFRFNIGAGTAEQGDSSGIKDRARRVECFLAPNGTYNWDKQAGYLWTLQQAKHYGVKDLIAFVNSPPVQFTKNGLGFKLDKDYLSNLKDDKYEAYGDFLADVVKHFNTHGLHFNYLSAVNEPQWDWSGKFGEAKQEGSPWQNEEIFKVIKAVDQSLSRQKLDTKILITEAAMLDHLYKKSVRSSGQIAAFWDTNSPMYTGNFKHIVPYVEGHGYFTENGDDNLIKTRQTLRDSLKNYYHGKLEYWQSEYSMLGDGYLEKTKGPRSAMDCALFLAKVIHHDFAFGNATAWHYWNAYEPGGANINTRYYLIALNRTRAVDTANLYTVTKNLWALGHYSLFVRPGMYRIVTERNDGLSDEKAAQQIMITAFKDKAGTNLVVNVINYTAKDTTLQLSLSGIAKGKVMRLTKRYVTSEKNGDDLKPYPIDNQFNIARRNNLNSNTVKLPARSITTFIYAN